MPAYKATFGFPTDADCKLEIKKVDYGTEEWPQKISSSGATTDFKLICTRND